MSTTQYPILDAMLKDLPAAPVEYRPTHFWEEGARQILEDLRSVRVEHFRRMQSALNFFVPIYGFPGYHNEKGSYRGVVDALGGTDAATPKFRMALEQFLGGRLEAASNYRVYLAARIDGPPYIDRASESTIGDPVEQFEFDGRRFSRSFLNYLLGLSFLKQHCDCTAISTVLEIGGGYGTLGEILNADPRNQCLYLNVDIPPTAFFSTYYLKQVLGGDIVCDYLGSRDLERIDIAAWSAKYRAAVLCPWQLPRLHGSIDLFVNFISFQEMEPGIVRNYLQQVTRLKARYVLLRNLLEGKQLRTRSNPVGVEQPIVGSDYDGYLPDYELVSACTEPFGYRTVDGFHSQLRLYRRCAAL